MRIGFGLSAGLAASLIVLMASAASPQGLSASLDLSGIAARANAAVDAAAAAQAAAAAAQAAIPQPCPTAPQADTLMGSVGGGTCFTKATDTRPTTVQTGVVTTAADGTWTIVWAKPFATANPYINPQPVNPSALQPVTCNPTASTATTASGKCWMQNVMTTPGVSLSLLNLQLVGAAASIQVRVAGRDLTQ